MDTTLPRFFGPHSGPEAIWITSGRFLHTLWHEGASGKRTVICRSAYGEAVHAKAEALQGVLDRGGRVDDLMDMVIVSNWPPPLVTLTAGFLFGTLLTQALYHLGG